MKSDFKDQIFANIKEVNIKSIQIHISEVMLKPDYYKKQSSSSSFLFT
jgi:hypothetical protein